MAQNTSRISSKTFGILPNRKTVTLYSLTNTAGSSIDIMDLGATIVSINMPDRCGIFSDITLGLEAPDQYMTESPYFGAVIGRFANRIQNGNFNLEGQDYTLPINNGANSLHGGTVGFDKKIWIAEPFEASDHAGLKLSLISEDGDQGYPGTLYVTVIYRFDDNNDLTIKYYATTDKVTVINLTQHSYFNLNGHASGSIIDHELSLNAEYYTPVDNNLIPTGEIVNVRGTPMDFTKTKTIGRDIENEQLTNSGGYDHNWVLDIKNNKPTTAATVFSPKSGRVLKVLTNEPGIQFYSGNFLDGNITGKEGAIYGRRNGFCLETQHFPDSPNKPNFPTTILKPDEEFQSTTIYKFSVRC